MIPVKRRGQVCFHENLEICPGEDDVLALALSYAGLPDDLFGKWSLPAAVRGILWGGFFWLPHSEIPDTYRRLQFFPCYAQGQVGPCL